MQRRDHQRRMALTMARQGESRMKFRKLGGAIAGVIMLWSGAAAAQGITEVQIINGLQGGPAVTVVVDPAALMAEVNANVGKGAAALPSWGQLANLTQLVVDIDATGKADYNLKLSLQRAEAIRAALTTTFTVAPKRLFAVGVGEELPLDPGNPDAAVNRRVQLINIGETK